MDRKKHPLYRDLKSVSLFCLATQIFICSSFAEAAQTGYRRPAQQAPAAPLKPSDGPSPNGARKLNVDGLRDKYWSQDSDGTLSVVQNRQFSKAWKFNFELSGGTYSSDPFVSSWSYGAQLGFNFGEYFGVHFMYWKFSNSFNTAYDTLVKATALSAPPGVGSNSNMAQSLIGGEVSWSLLYGKLSLLGKAILHFDLFLLGGVGSMQIDTGASTGERNFTSIAVWPGIGQQIYVTPWMAIRADYRLMIYGEDVVERNTPSTMGTQLSKKTTYAPSASLGFNFFFP